MILNNTIYEKTIENFIDKFKNKIEIDIEKKRAMDYSDFSVFYPAFVLGYLNTITNYKFYNDIKKDFPDIKDINILSMIKKVLNKKGFIL